LASGVLVGLVLVLVTVLNHWLVIPALGGMVNKDFMSVWGGARALILGLDPYDPQVWPDFRAQFGSFWFPDPTCPFPAWTLIFFIPLALFPIQVAGAIWMTISEVGVIVSIPIMLKAAGAERDGVVRIGMVLGAIASRSFLAGLFNGQMVSILVPVVAGAMLLYSRGRSFWFGVLLALLVTKPNLFPLFYVALALLMLLRRDWAAIGGLAAGGVALLGVSWIISPGWLFRWLRVGADKTIRFFSTPTLWGMSFDVIGGELWIPVAIAASALVGLATLVVVARWRDHWLPALGLALSASLLTTPYLRAYDHVLLLLPAMTAAVIGWRDRWWRLGTWLVVAWVIPWAMLGFAYAYGSGQWSALAAVAVIVYLAIGYGRARRV
jgi:hypothetical protein